MQVEIINGSTRYLHFCLHIFKLPLFVAKKKNNWEHNSQNITFLTLCYFFGYFVIWNYLKIDTYQLSLSFNNFVSNFKQHDPSEYYWPSNMNSDWLIIKCSLLKPIIIWLWKCLLTLSVIGFINDRVINLSNQQVVLLGLKSTHNLLKWVILCYYSAVAYHQKFIQKLFRFFYISICQNSDFFYILICQNKV